MKEHMLKSGDIKRKNRNPLTTPWIDFEIQGSFHPNTPYYTTNLRVTAQHRFKNFARDQMYHLGVYRDENVKF